MRIVPSALGVLLGLALVVYGVASLTGGWLGTPPWWESHRVVDLQAQPGYGGGAFLGWNRDPDEPGFVTVVRPRPSREWISGGVVVVGLGVVALGASSGRRHRGARS